MYSKYYNNHVIIKPNRQISPQDLELIELYFENTKQSGGSDTITNTYNPATNEFNLNYKQNETKQSLVNQTRDFKGYTFRIQDDESCGNGRTFKQLSNTLILSNIDENEDKCVIELYAEYLVNNDNEIDEVNKSILFKNTFYVKFKLDFDFKTVLKRLAKRPKLRQNAIKVYSAFDTNVFVVSLEGVSDFGLIEDHLDDCFNEQTHSYWQTMFKSLQTNQFVFVTFNGQVVLDGLKYAHEQLFNFQLIDDCFGENAISQMSRQCSHSSSVPETSPKKDSFREEFNQPLTPESFEDQLEPSDSDCQFDEYSYDFPNEDPLHDALVHLEAVLNDLNECLKESNAVAVKTFDDQDVEYVYISSGQHAPQIGKEQWLVDLKGVLNSYWKDKMLSRRIELKIESGSLNLFLNSLNESFDNVYCRLRTDKNAIDLVGYREQCMNAFQTINNEIERRINNKSANVKQVETFKSILVKLQVGNMTQVSKAQNDAAMPVDVNQTPTESSNEEFVLEADSADAAKQIVQIAQPPATLKAQLSNEEYIFRFVENDPFEDALINCPTILKNFNRILQGCQSIAKKSKNNSIICTRQHNLANKSKKPHEHWLSVLTRIIDEYWKANMLTRRIDFTDDTSVSNVIELVNEINKKCDTLYCQVHVENCWVDMVGFTNDLFKYEKEIQSKILEKAQNEPQTTTDTEWITVGVVPVGVEKASEDFVYNFESRDFFRDTLVKKPKIIEGFNKYLERCNAVCVQTKNKVQIRRVSEEQQSKVHWLKTLNARIDDYLVNKYAVIHVKQSLSGKQKNVAEFIRHLIKPCVVINAGMKVKDANSCVVEVCGYTEAVERHSVKIIDEIKRVMGSDQPLTITQDVLNDTVIADSEWIYKLNNDVKSENKNTNNSNEKPLKDPIEDGWVTIETASSSVKSFYSNDGEFVYNFESFEFFRDTLLKKPKIIEGFNKYVESSNAVCVQNKNKVQIRPITEDQQQTATQWLSTLNGRIIQYLVGKYIAVQLPQSLNDKYKIISNFLKSINKSNEVLNAEAKIKDGKIIVEVCGYTDVVERYKAIINDELKRLHDQNSMFASKITMKKSKK